jgi:hypothetical protein
MSVALLLLASLAAGEQPNLHSHELTLSPEDYSDFLTGFLVGIEIEMGTDDLTACADETYKAAEAVYQFVRYIREVHYSDFNRDIAMEELSIIFHSYAFGKINCVNVLQESTSLFNNFLVKLEHPVKLAQTAVDNLWFKGNYIYREFTRSQTGDSYKSGVHLGTAFALLIQD